MNNVVQQYMMMVVIFMLVTDDTKVVLYAVQNSNVSLYTRRLPGWYTTKELAIAMGNGQPIVRTYVKRSMLLDVPRVHWTQGSSMVLMHGARRYAQRMARKVAI